MDIASLATKHKQQSGFTIVELMVSASIIVVISVLAIVNFRGYEQKSSLYNEAERMSGVIRQAHINALTGLLVDGSRPLGGFGVHIEPCSADCSYFIFADDGSYQYEFGTDTIVQTINMLEDSVYISGINPGSSAVDIIFIPPQGLIYINGLAIEDSAQINLTFSNSSYSKDIILDRRSGKIEIQ